MFSPQSKDFFHGEKHISTEKSFLLGVKTFPLWKTYFRERKFSPQRKDFFRRENIYSAVNKVRKNINKFIKKINVPYGPP